MRSSKGKEGKPQTVLGKAGNARLESPTNALLKYRTRAGVTAHGACVGLRSGGRFFPFLILSLLHIYMCNTHTYTYTHRHIHNTTHHTLTCTSVS